jgi:hypothetical protein
MTADNLTPINPTTEPGTEPDAAPAATVGDLKAALTDRHGRGMSDAVAKVNALSVDVVKRATAEQITRTATDLAELAPLLVDNRARLSGQPDNPLEQAHRHLTELIRLYGVSEYLLGHGARRGAR